MEILKKYLCKSNISHKDSATVAYLAALDCIKQKSPEVAECIVQELKDQRSYLKLIASENYSSFAVQLAMGNWLTDKYAEGFAEHRFYAGCKNIDRIEMEAEKQLLEIFPADAAYVQPHSGSDANLVAFWAILMERVQNKELEKLGKKSLEELTPQEREEIRKIVCSQKMMGLSLDSGGHLTHGFIHNVSSKIMHAVTYRVDPKTERLDYKILSEEVKREKPLILLAGYSAYPRRLNFAKMREIADSCGAVLMVDMAHFAGLVAGKVFQGEENPIPYAHMITSTTHKTLRGPRGGIVLCCKEFEQMVKKGCPLVLGGPLPHVIAAKAIAFKEANSVDFQNYAKRVVDNARALAEGLRKRGVRLVTDGTDNHLVLLDTSSFGLTGRQVEIAFSEAKLTVNRNAIPNDKNGAWYTSGIRLGTPAVTTLGMGVDEMDEIADIMSKILSQTKPVYLEAKAKMSKVKILMDPAMKDRARQRVSDLLSSFPLYPEIPIDL